MALRESEAKNGAAERTEAEPYGWYVLGVLMLVYVFNFVDRQLLTILAPDLKRDLGISDSDFGFLYGTAFGVFYALFGIPLGRLADRWLRVRLLAIGLTLWSAMTALSGFSRGFGTLAAARIGVGIGEATASPCAYSLISDWFPPHRRATAIAVYSAGLYLGGGVSLFLGSSIAQAWNEGFAPGTAPFGLVGWQAAFLAVGLPGVVLAGWVATLREPLRGRFEPQTTEAKSADAEPASPWPAFMRDLSVIVPPFTLLGAARRGKAALVRNLAAAALAALGAALLTTLIGDPVQWIAVAIGCYAVFSWTSDLKAEDPEAHAAILGSRPFIAVVVGYGMVALAGYSGSAFTPLYAIEAFGIDPRTVGLTVGGLGALGGGLGVICGGALADRLALKQGEAGRVLVTLCAAAGAFSVHALLFTTENITLFYAAVFGAWFLFSATLGGASGAVMGMVAPNLRGTATATFFVGTTLLGLALGPYSAGKFANVLGELRLGLLAILGVAPFSLALLTLAYLDLRKAKTA